MRILSLILLLGLLTSSLSAAVGLVTVPERDVVRMTIYNAVDLTLVQESRTLILKQGVNRIQYQWAGTLIDATSLELRTLDKGADAEILGVIYPPNAPATLIWEVDSKIDGPARFEISYFTSGLSWNADYVLRATPDERLAELDGWVSVTNNSGEDYARAEVRLVVGTINLVERIRDLATGQLHERTRDLDKAEILSNRAEVFFAKDKENSKFIGGMVPTGLAAPTVESARLGDYHIFSVSGVQAVTNGATTRFKAITTKKPMAIEVLYRVGFMSKTAEKLYRFINDKVHELPDGPLPDGLWHIFRVTDETLKTLSYSGATHSTYVPPEQKVELHLGEDPGIAIKQVHQWHSEMNHHYNTDGNVDGWISHDRYTFTLVNTKNIPVSVEYLVHAKGDWTIHNLVGERRDQHTYRHQTQVAAGGKLDLGPFTISQRTNELVPVPQLPEVPALPKIVLKP